MIKEKLYDISRTAKMQQTKKRCCIYVGPSSFLKLFHFLDLIVFGGATPTVFIQTKEISSCLVSFVGNNDVDGWFTPLGFKTTLRKIQKVCIFYNRFGNADCHDWNTLSKINAEWMHRLTPIDNEECFSANVSLFFMFQSPFFHAIALTIIIILCSLCGTFFFQNENKTKDEVIKTIF